MWRGFCYLFTKEFCNIVIHRTNQIGLEKALKKRCVRLDWKENFPDVQNHHYVKIWSRISRKWDGSYHLSEECQYWSCIHCRIIVSEFLLLNTPIMKEKKLWKNGNITKTEMKKRRIRGNIIMEIGICRKDFYRKYYQVHNTKSENTGE